MVLVEVSLSALVGSFSFELDEFDMVRVHTKNKGQICRDDVEPE